MNDQRLLDALNDCIDCLGQGATLEQCLGRYPELADELRPLLRSGLATGRLRATHHEVRDVRGRLGQRFEETLTRWDMTRPRRRFNLWQFAALAATALIIGVLGLFMQADEQSGAQPTQTLAQVTAMTEPLDAFEAMAAFRELYGEVRVVSLKLDATGSPPCWYIWLEDGRGVCIRADDGTFFGEIR